MSAFMCKEGYRCYRLWRDGTKAYLEDPCLYTNYAYVAGQSLRERNKLRDLGYTEEQVRVGIESIRINNTETHYATRIMETP